MGLEPHHRAGHTRSWREEEAIATWAANRPPESPVEPLAHPAPPAEAYAAPDDPLGVAE